MNKRVIYYIILVIFTAITVYVVFTSQELDEIPELLNRTKRGYLLVAFCLMFLYLLINALIIQGIGSSISKEFNFRRSFFISLAGQYYSLITPFASGGQPAQVYLMKNKYNIPYKKGITVTLKKFIIFQMVVSLYAVAMFLFKYNLFMTKQKEVLVFIYIGLIVNIIGGLFIIILAYNRKIIRNILNSIIYLLKKLRLFNNFDKNKFNKHIDEYADNIHEIKNNKKMMLKLIGLTIIQLTCYFSITYFIYLSLGFNQAHYIDILAIQTVLYVVISFIPTPGNAGASESGFYIMFSIYFSKEVLLYAMLLWRIIIYYSNLLISGIVVLLDSLLHKTKIKFDEPID
ncbi:MAG: YbhN family protein [Eubacteriales bacterium]